MGAWGLDLHRGAHAEEKQAEKIKESGCVRMCIVILSDCYIFANVKREVPTPKAFFDIM